METVQKRPTREQKIPMSYEEYLTLEGHAEWVNGEAILFMPPNFRHNDIAGFIYALLRAFVEQFELGRVFDALAEMRAIPEGSSREPDVFFVAREHQDRITLQRLIGPADLVVEIISPESVARDRSEKFYEYQSAGVREYWLIDPRPGHERMDVWVLDAAGRYQPVPISSDGIFHSAVIEGFWFNADWLWAEELPKLFQVQAQVIGIDAPRDFSE